MDQIVHTIWHDVQLIVHTKRGVISPVFLRVRNFSLARPIHGIQILSAHSYDAPLKRFLETAPLFNRVDIGETEHGGAGYGHGLVLPEINLFCEECDREIPFDVSKNWIGVGLGSTAVTNLFVEYVCRVDRKSKKLFALRVSRPDTDTQRCIIQKLGEDPENI